MTSQELDQLKMMLAQGGPDFNDEAPTVRAQFDGLLASFPVDESLVFQERSIGGVPGLWLDAADASDSVVLYIHGGAYVVGTAFGFRGLASGIARSAKAAMFSIDYRLSPEHVYPAALDDAVAAYEGLLATGYTASQIFIVGDSAGGGLGLALIGALVGRGMQLPAGAVLLSPWSDLTLSGESMASKAEVDNSLDAPGLAVSAGRYAGGADLSDPSLSPLFSDFAGWPPLLIEVGSGEILLDDSTRLAARAGAADVDVTLHVWPEMVHDWSLFWFMLSEGRDLIAEVGAFIAKHLESEVTA